MIDIITRLREPADSDVPVRICRLLDEAAAEIERLRAPSPSADVVGLQAIGEINAGGTLTWFNPPIRPGTTLYAAPGSTLKPEEIECVCKRDVCTYDADFGCGLDRSKERHNV